MASGEREKRRGFARLKISAAFNKKSPNEIQVMIDLNSVRAFCFGFDCLALRVKICGATFTKGHKQKQARRARRFAVR